MALIFLEAQKTMLLLKGGSKKSKFSNVLKKAHKLAVAGGTSLLKLNRSNKELFMTAHRIDNFFVDVDASGKVTSGKKNFL